MKNQTRAYTYALATVAFWSTIATASKLSLRGLAPAELLLIAATISTIFLFCVVVGERKFSLLTRAPISQWMWSLCFGALNPFLYYLVLFKAYDLLPAQQAQIINYTWAITLSLLSIPFLGQKVSKRQWFAIILSYSGVLVIATNGNPVSLHFENPRGIGLALLSTLIWAMYWILNTRDKRDPVVGLLQNFLCALPGIILYVILVEGVKPVSSGALFGAMYIGIFEMGLSFVLWLKAMKLTTSTARIANLIFIAPFGSLFLIHFFVGEEIAYSTIIGLILVLGGLGVQSLQQKQKQK